MGSVVEIEKNKKAWISEAVRCKKCLHHWVACYHELSILENGVKLECPSCGNFDIVQLVD